MIRSLLAALSVAAIWFASNATLSAGDDSKVVNPAVSKPEASGAVSKPTPSAASEQKGRTCGNDSCCKNEKSGCNCSAKKGQACNKDCGCSAKGRAADCHCKSCTCAKNNAQNLTRRQWRVRHVSGASEGANKSCVCDNQIGRNILTPLTQQQKSTHYRCFRLIFTA